VVTVRRLSDFWSIHNRWIGAVLIWYLVGCSQTEGTQLCIRDAGAELVRIKDLDANELDSSFALRFENISNPKAPYPVRDNRAYAPTTVCEFQLGGPDSVSIQVLTMPGDPVCGRVDLLMARGSYRFRVVPSEPGVYSVVLTLGRIQWKKKIVVLN